ncbi:MAG: proline dehydrogenase family protein [Ignavibacteriaceae bacterium]|jgi:Proline dehydrogenase|nr:MAG: proline dehydrogenase [Chlorobiota bacterium]KXK02397.1 MAG: L-proline dehydrogenase [Chlorobi bacterium OLB4]MBV6397997.1 Proline dehydrogenase 2 [Ignavibacteria bacterium]MCC6886444.1 proline dehydrogenase family protein [Ignavibacteriales bacterium]MCE7952480.1 proline dehydrogenase [Chlorobi bacterium CHB7]MDL1886596.1 proline dehydrogenase [Ignavibacteria bacterium CHB1]MEB2329685.1 proline dehydrogenase family protein [Ignavibacteriaceae bacterium]OQY77303.1 MAG: proline dehydr
MSILNKLVVGTLPVLPRNFVRIFANKYIAGDKLSDAVSAVKALNVQGFKATMDVLGESISERDEALKSTKDNIDVLKAITDNNLDCNLSVKLTMLGLGIDKEFCLNNMREILSEATNRNIFVRIDMEDSSVTQTTLDVFNTLRTEFDQMGIVIQAYLRRSFADVENLSTGQVNLRICKGIYIEPEEIAFKGFQEVRDNFLKLVNTALSNGSYVGIATHDDFLVDQSIKIINELKLPKDKFEFQMLLGVRENLRDKILKEGYKLRIYVPFGERWYEYSIRRFKENPNIAGHVFKNIFSGN